MLILLGFASLLLTLSTKVVNDKRPSPREAADEGGDHGAPGAPAVGARALSAQAIREGRRLEALIADLLERAASR